MLKAKNVWIVGVLAFPLMFALGLCFFVYKLRTLERPTLEAQSKANLAVVLTGAPRRIEKALELLKEDEVKSVFISGVDKHVTPNEMANLHKIAKETQSQVYLGHESSSTLENAVETKAWLQAQPSRKFYLVTSYYHIPRSYLLLRAAMPKATIIPWPVWPAKEPQTIHQWLGRARIVLLEYFKLFGAIFQALSLRCQSC